MEIKDLCKKFNLPAEVADILAKKGYTKLHPPQATALKSGVLDGKNFVLAMPTASGKTLIAELAMIKSILSKKGKALYVVPLRALASEKYEDLKEKYSQLGLKIALASGDYDTPSKFLANYDIIVATSEKVDSLLRFRARWLTESLSIAAFDEIHLIDDSSRGPTLEILIARLKQSNPSLQLVGLSATIKNANQIAAWLEAECFLSSWRPVKLKEGVYYDKMVYFENGEKRTVKASSTTGINSLCLETVQENGQVLVFVNTRRSTQAEGRRIALTLSKALTDEEKIILNQLSKKLRSQSSESTKISNELAECIESGVAFHHAGLTHTQRKLIEDNFKENIIKVICCTPTLAAGVNLPARRVIIRDYKRFESSIGSHHIAVFEYKQMRGRAGRPKYDTYGESLLIAKSEDEKNVLFEDFICAESEPIISKLGQENALCMHILSSIAAGYVHTDKGLMDFLSNTFFATQEDPRALSGLTERIIEFLCFEDLITSNNGKYRATPFGNLVSRLYIDPQTGVIIRKGLKNSMEIHPSTIAILHLISSCPNMPNLRLNKKNKDEVEMFFGLNSENLLLPFERYYSHSDYNTYLQSLTTALMFNEWVEEIKEDTICDKYPVGPGDIRRLIETAKWLLYASQQIAELFNINIVALSLQALQKRIQYGIKEELLSLVSIKNVGRVRARNLYNSGLKSPSDIKRVSIDALMKAGGIGKTVAAGIKKQIESDKFKIL
jgi:helicase